MRSPSSAGRIGRRARAIAVTAAIGLSLVAGACGGDSDSDGSAATEPAGNAGKALAIKDFAFSPEPLEVPMGTVVRVTNEDDAAHTATAEDGSFDTGTLAKGESKEITLSKAGDVAYQCDIHDYMKGVIRVTP